MVAGGNQLFQAQPIEVQDKILKKVGFKGIVAVAQHSLSLEMLAVIPHFLFDIGQQSIKFIVFSL